MASLTIGLDAKGLAEQLAKKDAKKFKKFVDVLKRYSSEEKQYSSVIDAWSTASATVQVACGNIGSSAAQDKSLSPFTQRAAALQDASEVVEDLAQGVLSASPAGKYKSFTDDFQKLAQDVQKVNPGLGKDMMTRLAEYATAENAMKKAARSWLVRLQEIATEGKSAMEDLDAKNTDENQTRKFIQARMINVPKDLIKALEGIGA